MSDAMLPFREENVAAFFPQELSTLPQFVVWKWQRDGDRMTKVPYNPNTRRMAKTTAPKDWCALDEAMHLLRLKPDDYQGLGFVFTKAAGVVGVDLDHCRDRETGKIDPWALAVLEQLQSYTEISPSGTGLHVFIYGVLPGLGRRVHIHDPGAREKAAIEAYDQGRYFTVTGDRLPEYGNKVLSRQPMLEALHALMEQEPAPDATAPVKRPDPSTLPAAKVPDEELLDHARRAKNGAQFETLWAGDTTAHGGDDSSADLALCAHLAFWTGPDPSRIDRLFRLSGLFRKKWERKDYRDRTVNKALSGTQEFWKGPRTEEGGQSRTAPLRTDLGNARRFVTHSAGRVKHCAAFGWMVWDGKRWLQDETGSHKRMAKAAVRAIWDEAKNAPEEDASKVAGWALKSQMAARINAMLDLGNSEPEVAVPAAEFDPDKRFFNLNNGVLDLVDFKVSAHDRKRMITKLAPVSYDAGAKAPRFQAFLQQIIPDAEIRSFLQRLVGHAVAGGRERIFPVFWGSGGNGKTVFTELLMRVFGDYAKKTPASTFLEKRTGGGAIPNDVAALVGARLVLASEPPAGVGLDEGLIKEMTGGDTMTARFLHREFFSFAPQFTPVLVTNHKPTVRGSDNGIWDRVLLIPFTVTIPKKDRNPELINELVQEVPGVLAWAIEGCRQWRTGGLRIPDQIRAATDAYRAEMDILGAFFNDACTRSPSVQVRAGVLRASYIGWCERNRERPLTSRVFATALQERGLTQKRTAAGLAWVGLGLRVTEKVPENMTGDNF